MARKRRPLPRPRRAAPEIVLGAPPGTLTAPPGAHPTGIRVIDYSADELVETEAATVDELREIVERDSNTWIDVVGLADADLIGELGGLLGVTPLVMEDILNVWQRPKVEDHESFGYFVSRFVRFREPLEVEQLSLVFGERIVVTFQERPGDCFDGVRERIRAGRKRIRGLGSDYLAYALIDALIDSYLPISELNRERLEEIEDLVSSDPTADVVGRIHGIKRELRLLRQTVTPTTDAVRKLMSPEVELVSPETRVYLADCWDHARRLQDEIDAERELGNDLVDLQVSQLGHRLNEVMKVLTIFAAIFIPITFIAGLYGMNFDPEASPWNMPELSWAYGYPAALGAMLIVAVVLLLYFVRKGWIGGRRRSR